MTPTITAATKDRPTPTASASLPPTPPTADQNLFDAQVHRVGGGGSDTRSSHSAADTQSTAAAAGQTGRPTPATLCTVPKPGSLGLDDPTLSALASLVDDLERTRISALNRHRIITGQEPDSDGITRSHGIPPDHPAAVAMAAVAAVVKDVEAQAVKALQKAMLTHPLGPWVKAQKGIGEKQAGRLLSSLGDPYLRPEHALEDGAVVPAQPRTVSQLWAMCGLHTLPADQAMTDARKVAVGGDQTGSSDPGHASADAHRDSAWVAARRRKGVKDNWSTKAKTRVYTMAVDCLKQLDAACKTHDPETASLWAIPSLISPSPVKTPRTDQSQVDAQYYVVGAGPGVNHPDGQPTSAAHPTSAVGVVHLPGCTCSPYRVAYDRRRALTADRTHEHPCVRCGPAGKPAQPGTPWSKAHAHADALRISSKAILRDLWRAAKDHHTGSTS